MTSTANESAQVSISVTHGVWTLLTLSCDADILPIRVILYHIIKFPCDIISLHRPPQACYKPLKVFERPFLWNSSFSVHKRLRPPARLANVDDDLVQWLLQEPLDHTYFDIQTLFWIVSELFHLQTGYISQSKCKVRVCLLKEHHVLISMLVHVTKPIKSLNCDLDVNFFWCHPLFVLILLRSEQLRYTHCLSNVVGGLIVKTVKFLR